MRVSVLIPTLNRLQYLKEALSSARAQSHADLEILVSDDGSSDGTRDYVAEIARHDQRVRLLTDNPTPGIFTNMNHLVARARGDALCLLGDDDRLDPSYVRTLVEPLMLDPHVVAVFCDHRIIDAAGATLHDASLESSILWGRAALPRGKVEDPLGAALRQSMCLGFSLFRASVFRGGDFDVRCGGAADVDFSIRLASSGDLYYVPQALGEYRVHPGTATATKARYMIEGAIAALQKHHFGEPGHERKRQELLRQRLLAHAVLLATTDRAASLNSGAAFVKAGGSWANPSLVAVGALCLLPRSVAEPARVLLRGLKRSAHGERVRRMLSSMTLWRTRSS